VLRLVKTLFDNGGYHIQFNVLNTETLRDAQKHPEKYRDLVVRVAGSALSSPNCTPACRTRLSNGPCRVSASAEMPARNRSGVPHRHAGAESR